MHLFEYPIDLSNLEIQNVLLQNVVSEPASPAEQQGKIAFLTGVSNSILRPIWFDGAAWHRIQPTHQFGVRDGWVYATSDLIQVNVQGNVTGNSGTATSLAAAINLSVSGKATASAVSLQAGGASPALNITALSVAPGDIALASGSLISGNGSNVGQVVARNSISLSEWAAPTADVSWNSKRITSLLDPVNAQDAATRGWVLGVVSGVSPKSPVRVATAASLGTYSVAGGAATVLTNTGTLAALVVDGVSMVVNDRVLVKNETGGQQKDNGVYTVTTVGTGAVAWVLTRATDADSDAEVSTGDEYFVTAGTANGGTKWALQTPEPLTLATTALTFVQTDGNTSYSAGQGMVAAGTVFHFARSTNYPVKGVPFSDTTSSITFTAAAAAYQVLVADSGGTPTFGQVNLGQAAAVTGTLTVGNGGTGIVSYAVGDLLYASGSTTLSKRAGVATGNALLSGGVATAPDWGKIGLQTHISGTLLVANGGTGLTTLASNGVLLGQGSSAIGAVTGLSAQILQCNGGAVPTFVGLSGDATIAVGGALTIAANAVTWAKMQTVGQDTVAGRVLSGSGVMTELSMATLAGKLNPLIAPTVTVTGDVTGSGPISAVATTIANLPFAKLANGSALSVLGVTGNLAASNASIAASTDGHCLRRSGTTLGFGTLDLTNTNATTGPLPTSRGGTGRTAALVYPNVAGLVPRFRKVTLASGASSYTGIAHGYGNAQIMADLVDSDGRRVGAKIDITSTTVAVTFGRTTTKSYTLMLCGHDQVDPLS